MKRIQRKRTKGWKMPEGAKYVGRPTKWGNPYKVIKKEGFFMVTGPWGKYRGWYTEKAEAANKAIGFYRIWLTEKLAGGDLDIYELRGHDLACFCPMDQPCHVDVLLEHLKEMYGG